MFNKLYAIKDSANVKLISLKTGRVLLSIPQPNSMSQAWSNSGETYARNHGTNAVTWDGNKEVELTANVEMLSSELMALMSKAELVKGDIDVRRSYELKVSEDKQVLEVSVLGGRVKRVTDIHILNGDKTRKADITDSSVVDLVGGTITLEAKADDVVLIEYEETVNRTHYTIKDKDDRPEDYMLVFDTLGKTQETSEEGYFQYIFYKVHINFGYTLDHDTENVANVDLTFSGMKDSEGRMCTYVNLFDEEEEVITPKEVYVGGILDSDKATLAVDQNLLDGLTKVETTGSSVGVTFLGTAIDGKSMFIVSDHEIKSIIDATNLDITKDWTFVTKDFDGVNYYVAYETDSTPNNNLDVNVTIKLA